MDLGECEMPVDQCIMLIKQPYHPQLFCYFVTGRNTSLYDLSYRGHSGHILYCRSGNTREVLIFANFARRTNSRIQESREKYYYNSATKEKFANCKLCEKS